MATAINEQMFLMANESKAGGDPTPPSGFAPTYRRLINK